MSGESVSDPVKGIGMRGIKWLESSEIKGNQMVRMESRDAVTLAAMRIG